jgi:hypothetical protein
MTDTADDHPLHVLSLNMSFSLATLTAKAITAIDLILEEESVG